MSGLPLRLQDVRRLLKQAVSLELSASAVQRLKWYAYALEHKHNISRTCRHFGIARSTFLRWAERFDPSNPDTLEETSRRPHTVRVPETDPQAIEHIRLLRQEFPLMGKVGIAKLLKEKFETELSVSTVGRIIARHNFFFADKPSHESKRTVVIGDETESVIAAIKPNKSSDESEGLSSLIPHPSA
jgi:transposase-like protein